MIEPLTDLQCRVIGSLAEKAATVPDTYPMTLRGLQTACNQKNSRDPVMSLEEHEVQRTLDECKAAGLVRFVYASHGARTTKYRHVLDEVLHLDASEAALITVLLLRGPQTVNELRTRSERAHVFADNDAVVAALDALAARESPFVVHLPRQSGQKETRWAHLLGTSDPRDDRSEHDVPDPATREHRLAETDGDPATGASPVGPAPTGLSAGGEVALLHRIAALELRVATLEDLLTGSASAPEEHPPT